MAGKAEKGAPGQTMYRGRIYKRDQGFLNKRSAQRRAKELREQGKQVRIVEGNWALGFPTQYVVYKRG